MKRTFMCLFSTLFIAALSLPVTAYWYTDPCDAGNHNVVPTGSALDFTPGSATLGTTLSTHLDTDNLVDPWAHGLVHAATGERIESIALNTEGGVVYKFSSSTPLAMEIDIDTMTYFAWWSGRKVVVYYSDNNAWSDLDDCAGSVWSDGAVFESNPNWTLVDSRAEWGGEGVRHTGTQPYGTGTGLDSVYTNDGTFYVRVDLHNRDGVGSPWLFDLDVYGTVVPEPLTLTLLGLGGLVGLKRRN